MAEVAGLALGGLAVTSLLTSCIDILDYFHNGRYWLYDLGLVLTKVDLLKLRLTQLEAQLQLIPPAMEKADPLTIGCDDVVAALPVNDIDLAAMAQSGLSGVNAILQRTNHLCKRYSYGPITAASGKTPSGKSHTTTPKDAPSGWGKIHVAQADARQKQSPPPAVPSRGWQTLPRKVSWALCDKKRFDSLILDLDFLLSNLEKVVPPLPGTPSHESWGPLVRLGDYIGWCKRSPYLPFHLPFLVLTRCRAHPTRSVQRRDYVTEDELVEHSPTRAIAHCQTSSRSAQLTRRFTQSQLLRHEASTLTCRGGDPHVAVYRLGANALWGQRASGAGAATPNFAEPRRLQKQHCER
jgi:hypothetical protein